MRPITTNFLQLMFGYLHKEEACVPGRRSANVLNSRGGVLLLALLASFACHAELSDAIQVCGNCHGPTGVAVQPKIPHLNGQLPVFLSDTMKAYATGSRATVINQHKSFPAAELEALANFYGSQRDARRPTQQTDPAIVAKGEGIYGNRCADCHGDGGRESDKDAPLMAAQDKEFMAAQALMFKAGTRKFPFMMDDAYRGLSDADLAAVAEYFAAQEQFPAAATKKRKRK